jgi:hypothetical protein
MRFKCCPNGLLAMVGPLVLYSYLINKFYYYYYFLFLLLFFFIIHNVIVNKYIKKPEVARALYGRARFKTYSKL